METVQGYHLDFVVAPHQLSLPLPVSHSQENSDLIDLEIQRMLQKEAVHVVSPGDTQQGFVSTIFLVPPKRGWSEACCEPPRFKSVSLLRTFQNGGHSYVRGPVKEKRLYGQDRPEGCLFHSAHMEEPPQISEVHLERDNVRVCLPSLRHVKRSQGIHKAYEASRIGLLRQLGIRFIIYLDDILIMAPSRALALQHASTTLNLLEGLGFMVNYQKSVPVPATTMEFLGFVVDSLTLSLALPRDKVRKVSKECQHLIDSPLVSVRQLAKLLGHLTSTIQAVFPGPLNFRHLQSEKNRAYQQSLTYES